MNRRKYKVNAKLVAKIISDASGGRFQYTDSAIRHVLLAMAKEGYYPTSTRHLARSILLPYLRRHGKLPGKRDGSGLAADFRATLDAVLPAEPRATVIPDVKTTHPDPTLPDINAIRKAGGTVTIIIRYQSDTEA